MAGSLIKIDEFTTSSAVASVTIGGGSSGSSGLNASIDSTYDVYMFSMSNVVCTSSQPMLVRFTVSGSPDTSANYDEAHKYLKSSSAFANLSGTNQTTIYLSVTTLGAGANGIYYLFNFNNSSEYSFITNETTNSNASGLFGLAGGGVNTVAQSCDGLYIFGSNSFNFTGNFTLYGLKK